MTTFWCPWCGATTERDGPSAHPRCSRCVAETITLFGFWGGTLMQPLRPGERPGTPAGARRQFEFRDGRSGELLTATDALPPQGYGPLPE